VEEKGDPEFVKVSCTSILI